MGKRKRAKVADQPLPKGLVRVKPGTPIKGQVVYEDGYDLYRSAPPRY